jgi:flagellar basal-body rod modification protein FlgD
MPITQGITDGYGPVMGSPGRDYSEVSKLDFMSLLVAQIQHQDPMSPMDNAEFTAQITQFTMLEELETLNQKMDDNLLMSQSLNNTAMLGLVGRNVTVDGNYVTLDEDGASRNTLSCQGPGTAEIKVRDANGNLVATYTRSVAAGANDITWNGTDSNGEDVSHGEYTLDISVTNGDHNVAFGIMSTGPVDGLRYEDGVAVVTVNGQEYYVSQIYEVS